LAVTETEDVAGLVERHREEVVIASAPKAKNI
jgi:hypothetical protein